MQQVCPRRPDGRQGDGRVDGVVPRPVEPPRRRRGRPLRCGSECRRGWRWPAWRLGTILHFAVGTTREGWSCTPPLPLKPASTSGTGAATSYSGTPSSWRRPSDRGVFARVICPCRRQTVSNHLQSEGVETSIIKPFRTSQNATQGVCLSLLSHFQNSSSRVMRSLLRSKVRVCRQTHKRN